MGDLQLEDRCTKTPAITNIIAVKQNRHAVGETVDHKTEEKFEQIHTPVPSFSIIYESIRGRNTVRVSALPVEMTLNKLCIQKLLGLFLPSPSWTPTLPPSSSTTASLPSSSFHIHPDSEGSIDSMDFNFRTVGSPHADSLKDISIMTGGNTSTKGGTNDSGSGSSSGTYEIIFEAHAPKIIIPEDSSSDHGYLLLDTGYLAVKVSQYSTSAVLIGAFYNFYYILYLDNWY